MNPDLDRLQPYPFEKLRALLDGVVPASLPPVSLSIGEPKHPPPEFVLQRLSDSLGGLSRYPGTRGLPELRESIADWLCRRFAIDRRIPLAERHVLPVNGTREGLFAIAQCLLDRQAETSTVLMPNPFYQIYEGATLLAGGSPDFYAIGDDADLDLEAIEPERFDRCQILYLCTPGNPTGSTVSLSALQALIEKAQRHDFVIVSDECYSEIYRQSVGAPAGLLQAAASLGLDHFDRCLVFHSLSKRSNLPGMRSGFVAGDATLIERFLAYRTYHGCSMPEPVQLASAVAWADEDHVVRNRAAYDAKYEAVLSQLDTVLPLDTPPAGFYLWPQLGLDDQSFTRTLLEQHNLRVVPGSFLARDVSPNGNPGTGRLRLALVAPLEDCIDAARRLAESLNEQRTETGAVRQVR